MPNSRKKSNKQDAAPTQNNRTRGTGTRRIDDSATLPVNALSLPSVQRRMQSMTPSERKDFLQKYFPQILDTLYIEEE